MSMIGRLRASIWTAVFLVVFAASAETYKYTGDTLRAKNANPEYWEDESGNHPQYAPTDLNTSGSGDIYIVKDGKQLPATANAASLRYYPKLVIGEVGGTVGKINSECQKGNGMTFDDVTFANGNYWDGGASGFNQGVDCRGYLRGNIRVTAPESAPFTFDFRYGDSKNEGPRKVFYEAVFDVAEGCAYKHNDTHDVVLTWEGSLEKFLGTLDLSKHAGMSVTFQDTIGTTNFKELKFCGGSTHTNNCVTAPLKARTLTAGDGVTFRLAASTQDNVVRYASLKCETAALAGTMNLSLDAFADPVSAEDNNLEIVLLEATGGGLTDAMFNVDLGENAKKATFKGCAVSDDGTKLVARFEIPGDKKYYLKAGTSYNNVADATAWLKIDGETMRAPTNPQNEEDQCEFMVNQGRTAWDTCYNDWARDIYGKSITFGEIGGTKGIFGFTSSFLSAYTFFHATAYFASGSIYIRGDWLDTSHRTGACLKGAVVVTAPATDPFIFEAEGGSVNRPWLVRWENSFSGDADCGIKTKKTRQENDSAHRWEFLGDLSGYKGSMDLSPTPNVSPVFFASVGTIDMKSLTFAADQKVTLVGARDGSGYQLPCLKAQTFTLGGDLSVTLDLAERIPSAVSRLAVLQTSGAIDASNVKIQAQGVGAKRFKGVAVETTDGMTTVYALVPPPGICLIVR